MLSRREDLPDGGVSGVEPASTRRIAISLSPRPNTIPRLKAAVAAVALIALVGVAAPASGAPNPAGAEHAQRSTRTLDLNLTPGEPGLSERAPSKALARAALGGLRVVWSQLDVTVVAERVLTISATVVPVGGRDVAGERRVSRRRALAIALRAVPGATEALDPLPAAYAGSPSAARDAERRRARRAWVVEVQQPAEAGQEMPSPLCIVVDAKTAKVIGRWPGIADRPESGPRARGAADELAVGAELVRASARDARDGPAFTALIWDGRFTNDPFEAPRYAHFITRDDPRISSNWPSYQAARLDNVTPVGVLEAASANVGNVARCRFPRRTRCSATAIPTSPPTTSSRTSSAI